MERWFGFAPNPIARCSCTTARSRVLATLSSIGPFPVDRDADYTALIKLEKLEPATTYYYRAAVTGKQPGYIARFVTAPRPDDAAKVSFCCSGDTRESYKPFTVMNAIRAQHPDFFLHLGDTIYADRGGTAHQLRRVLGEISR